MLSSEDVAALVAASQDPDAFAKALPALGEETTRTGRTRASVMLDELNAQAESGFAIEHIPAVIKSLTNIGDQLWIESGDEFFGVDNESRINWLIGGLLGRIPQEERCDLLSYRLLWILAEWRRWGDPDAVRMWMADVLGDDAQLGALMVTLASERMSSRGARHQFDPRWLDDYADRTDVVAAVRRLRDATGDDHVAEACDQYLLEHEMLEEGKNPESRLDWE